MWWCDAWISISRLTHVRTCSISRPSVESISLGGYLHFFCIYARFGRLTSPACCPAASLPIPGSSWSLRQGGLDAKWWCQLVDQYTGVLQETTASHPHIEGFPAHVPWNMIEPNLSMVTMGPPLRISTNKRWIQMAMLTHATTEMNSCWPSNPSKSKVLYVSRILRILE